MASKETDAQVVKYLLGNLQSQQQFPKGSIESEILIADIFKKFDADWRYVRAFCAQVYALKKHPESTFDEVTEVLAEYEKLPPPNEVKNLKKYYLDLSNKVANER